MMTAIVRDDRTLFFTVKLAERFPRVVRPMCRVAPFVECAVPNARSGYDDTEDVTSPERYRERISYALVLPPPSAGCDAANRP